MYIEKINGPADVKRLSAGELETLSEEVRSVLLKKLSEHGGHVGPNLGMVEATIALHYVFNSPIDKIVYDVSHQSYTHKILTGRKSAFMNAAEYDEVSGYTEPSESEHDFFVIGHTSTSVSLATGLAKARDLKGDTGNVIAVIGDGSLSGGEAFEGLNNAAELGTNFIVIVNDNQMSIAENHGGLYRNLQLLRDTDGQAPCNFFTAMGLDYLYVKDGNDVQALISAFQKVKDIDHPVVVHINTLKGKGYRLAEQQQERFHYSIPFSLETGNPSVDFGNEEDYGDLTARYGPLSVSQRVHPLFSALRRSVAKRRDISLLMWALPRNMPLPWLPPLLPVVESLSSVYTVLSSSVPTTSCRKTCVLITIRH